MTKAQISSILQSQYYGMFRTDEYRMGKYQYLSVLEKVASVAILVAGKYDVRILILRIWCGVYDVGIVTQEYDDVVLVVHVWVDHPISI